MSMASSSPIAAPPWKHGSPAIPMMPPAWRSGGRRRMPSAPVMAPLSEPVPSRLDVSELARGARSWRAIAAASLMAAFVAGGAVGWMAHGASAYAPSRFDIFTTQALDAHKTYVVEVRHPVEVTGAERPHLVQWLSKRLDPSCACPTSKRAV